MLVSTFILGAVFLHAGQRPVWRLKSNEAWAERYISPEQHVHGRDVYVGHFTVRAPRGRPITLVGVSTSVRGERVSMTGTWTFKTVSDNGFVGEWDGLLGFCDIQEAASAEVPFPSGYMPVKHSKTRLRRTTKAKRTTFAGTGTHYRVSFYQGDYVKVCTYDGRVSVYYDDLYFCSEADLTQVNSPVYVGPDDIGAPGISPKPPPPPGRG